MTTTAIASANTLLCLQDGFMDGAMLSVTHELSIYRLNARTVARAYLETVSPVPMILHCPECGERHIDKGEFATRHHHTHACQGCGFVWRPAVVPTVGVRFLPGFKDKE